ncbi:hypothetical protein E2562_035551 [Oryza meyeriana var. granulata]|uniref:Uncharacterized protein n=1 Tax=Oryza meyeriana var. granulata TaxID=110450 RepID=A0A6G1DS73_9ORYZ|nr:hypothetical protein E2562_035551 [Oryza meyeriana var. granulata]
MASSGPSASSNWTINTLLPLLLFTTTVASPSRFPLALTFSPYLLPDLELATIRIPSMVGYPVGFGFESFAPMPERFRSRMGVLGSWRPWIETRDAWIRWRKEAALPRVSPCQIWRLACSGYSGRVGVAKAAGEEKAGHRSRAEMKARSHCTYNVRQSRVNNLELQRNNQENLIVHFGVPMLDINSLLPKSF